MERIKQNLYKKHIKINGTEATANDLIKLFENLTKKNDTLKKVVLSKKSMYIYTI